MIYERVEYAHWGFVINPCRTQWCHSQPKLMNNVGVELTSNTLSVPLSVRTCECCFRLPLVVLITCLFVRCQPWVWQNFKRTIQFSHRIACLSQYSQLSVVHTSTFSPWQALFAHVAVKNGQLFPWQVSLLPSWHASFSTRRLVKVKYGIFLRPHQ